MDDEHVLRMPVRRFWAMESCIGRVSAAQDFRTISVNQAQMSEEAARKVQEKLTLELGETQKIDRSAIEAPEPGAKQKMMNFLRR